MLANPKIGERVLIRYGKRVRADMPLHGLTGIVKIRSAGRPRNHGIEIDGRCYVVPCGNLQRAS